MRDLICEMELDWSSGEESEGGSERGRGTWLGGWGH